MNTSRPLYTPENTVITWRDDDEPYAKDGSIWRRYFSAVKPDDPQIGRGYLCTFIKKDSPFVEVEDFEVWEGDQGRGVGKMILRAAVAHLKTEGFTELYSEEVGPTALYVRRSVLGEDMQFYQHDDEGRSHLADVTFNDALRHAYGAKHDRKLSKRPSELRTAYGISLELASVDTTDWELPTQYDEYAAHIAGQAK